MLYWYWLPAIVCFLMSWYYDAWLDDWTTWPICIVPALIPVINVFWCIGTAVIITDHYFTGGTKGMGFFKRLGDHMR